MYDMSRFIHFWKLRKSNENDLLDCVSPNGNEALSLPNKSPAHVARNRLDPPAFDPASLWAALSRTPGVGVAITDVEGRLLFVNDTTMVLFSESPGIDYIGKRISDFHPPAFVRERLAMIAQVIEEDRPLSIHHVYHGRRIESTVWPIRDRRPPRDRVIVISHSPTTVPSSFGGTTAFSNSKRSITPQTAAPEVVSTKYIDLGPFDILTRRELEVFIMLGHGLSVPSTAKILHRSPKTIQRHKASISQKLHLSGQVEFVSLVTSAGLEISDVGLKRLRK